MQKTYAIIVAAGQGQRAGGNIAKQWQPLCNGLRVIDHTITCFERHAGVDQVVVVTNDPDDLSNHPNIITARGGDTRMQSVASGLMAIPVAGAAKVLIHDGARPCVSQTQISTVIAALDHNPAVIPALRVNDAVFVADADVVGATVDRTPLRRAQTPQGFSYDAIMRAFEQGDTNAPDDATLARDAGIDVHVITGEEDNIKITYPEDFAKARRILEAQMKVRLGNGYDVHAFATGDAVILCGVSIPHDKALLGHSDADVAMHAITDAIYGALAQGDIGQHFPPSDPQWKGAASDIFLKHAVQLARDMGFEMSNIDCTIVCEHPKIGPHADAMRANLSRIMGIDMADISVKATTSEKLGFTGRSEGIAALATAALVST